jgi:hypothetical protein
MGIALECIRHLGSAGRAVLGEAEKLHRRLPPWLPSICIAFLGQPLPGYRSATAGLQAKEALAAKIGSAPVACNVKDKDKYGRTVAACFAAEGKGGDLGAFLVENGYAVAYRCTASVTRSLCMPHLCCGLHVRAPPQLPPVCLPACKRVLVLAGLASAALGHRCAHVGFYARMSYVHMATLLLLSLPAFAVLAWAMLVLVVMGKPVLHAGLPELVSAASGHVGAGAPNLPCLGGRLINALAWALEDACPLARPSA